MPSKALMTRRDAILIGLTFPAGIASPASSKDFWNEKPPAEWTPDEIQQLLTKSPWAKEASVSYNAGPGGMGGGRSGRSRGGMGGMGGRGGIGVIGGDGGGGGGGGGRGRAGAAPVWEAEACTAVAGAQAAARMEDLPCPANTMRSPFGSPRCRSAKPRRTSRCRASRRITLST